MRQEKEELMVVDGERGEVIIKKREKGNLCLEAMNFLNCWELKMICMSKKFRFLRLYC